MERVLATLERNRAVRAERAAIAAHAAKVEKALKAATAAIAKREARKRAVCRKYGFKMPTVAR